MEEHSFTNWLRQEVSAARCALLTLFEKRDRLLFIDGPQLEREYMEKVGHFEETVIREEIEMELLQKKQRLIQTALNRREPIDEAAIDAQINQLRQEKLKEAEGVSLDADVMELTPEEAEQLQDLYHTIVRCYHPQMHPELTQAHKRLFPKAQDAYRRKDLAALQLIHEMLLSADGDVDLGALLDFLMDAAQQQEMEIVPKAYSTDYALASTLYPFFAPTSEEAAIQEEWDRCKAETDAIVSEMKQIQSEFPFIAAKMLADPAQVDNYKKELEYRFFEAKKKQDQLSLLIRDMTRRVAVYE